MNGRMGAIVAMAVVAGATSLNSRSSLAEADGGSRPAGKLYVCNNEGTDFHVIDLRDHRVLKVIDVGGQPHGITVTPAGDRAYLSCSGPDDVIAFDPATDAELWRTDCGPNPHMLAITPDGRYVFVGIFGERGSLGQTDVIDTERRTRIRTVETGLGPHVLYAPNDRHVYVTAWVDRHISVLDARTHEVARRIPIPGIPRPIAVDPDEQRLYAAISGFHGFIVVDLGTGLVDRIVEHPPYPPEAPVPEHNTPVHGLAFRPASRELFVTSVIDDKVYVYDLPACDLSGGIEVGYGPNWIAFAPDGQAAYVSNALADTVSVIDAASRVVVATISVGKAPKRLAVVGVPAIEH